MIEIHLENIAELRGNNFYMNTASVDTVKSAKEYYDNITVGVPKEVYTKFLANLVYIQKISQINLKKNFIEDVSYDDIRNFDTHELDEIAGEIVKEYC